MSQKPGVGFQRQQAERDRQRLLAARHSPLATHHSLRYIRFPMEVLYPLRPAFKPALRYGSLTLRSRYLLSPLAGFTNLSFRRVVHELAGVGLTTTDLVNARGILAESPKTLSMIETCPA